MEKYKILFVDSFDEVSHALRHVVLQIIGVKEKGHDVEVLTQLNDKTSDKFNAHGIKVYKVDNLIRGGKGGIEDIRGLLLKNNYDILQLMNKDSIIYGVKAAKGIDVKVVAYRGSSSLYWHDLSNYRAHLNPRVDGITCVSDVVRDHVKKNLLWQKKVVRTVYRGVDFHAVDHIEAMSRESMGIPDDAVVVCSVGNLRKVKGFKYLLEACKQLENDERLHFVFVGNETDNAEVKAKVAKMNSRDRIHLLGFQKDALKYTKMADIYVQPSLKEGLSKTINEAILLNISTIITSKCGNTEVLENGISSIIVDPKSSTQIAKSITRLADDPKLRKQIGMEGKKALHQRLTVERGVNQTMDFYQELMTK